MLPEALRVSSSDSGAPVLPLLAPLEFLDRTLPARARRCCATGPANLPLVGRSKASAPRGLPAPAVETCANCILRTDGVRAADERNIASSIPPPPPSRSPASWRCSCAFDAASWSDNCSICNGWEWRHSRDGADGGTFEAHHSPSPQFSHLVSQGHELALEHAPQLLRRRRGERKHSISGSLAPS
jgi:hypothetical protein